MVWQQRSCWRRQGWSLQSLLIAGCLLLVGSALWFTHSRGGILASLLAGSAAALALGRRWLGNHKGWLTAGLVGVAGLVAVGLLTFAAFSLFEARYRRL